MYTKLAIKNWVNSSGFNVILDEIISFCNESIDTYCSMRDRGEYVSWMKSSLAPEIFVFQYLLTTRFPTDLFKDMKAEIMKRYGSLLHKKMEERLRTNNLRNDF